MAAISGLYELRAMTAAGKVAKVAEEDAAETARREVRSDRIIGASQGITIIVAAWLAGRGEGHMVKVGGGEGTLEACGATRGR